jgi:hypothetical protein
MKPLTWDQWKAAGFAVKRGERSIGHNKAGVATFTRDQVVEVYDLGDDRETLEDGYAD